MCREKEVIFYCVANNMDSEGIDIYINGTRINDNQKQTNNNFQYKWLCMPGKYNIRVVEKNPLDSIWWFLYPILSMVGILLSSDGEIDIKSPSFKIEEGELCIVDNADLKIELKKSEVFKQNTIEIKYSNIFIEPGLNCSYNCLKQEVVTTSKLRRRFIISVLLPISLAFLFMIALLLRFGFNLIERGSFIGGFISGLFAIFIIAIYIIMARNKLKIAFSKKL